MNHAEKLQSLYNTRAQKALDDQAWAFRPTSHIPASELKSGDAIYAESDGAEFLVIEARPISKKIELTVASFGLVQPNPFLISPEAMVMASPLA